MTTEIESVTNENESSSQRSVSVLLNILQNDGTYQEMTDAEIQSIVDYEKHISYVEGKTEELQQNYMNYNAQMQSQTATALQAQESMLQSIIDRASNLQLQVVQHG